MFSTTEMNGMREAQTAHMMDVCVIYHVTAKTKNARGESVKTFDAGEQTICGLEMQPEPKTYGESWAEANIDAVLRLPLGTVCSVGDEIEIIARFGEEIPPKRYEVDRFMAEGVSGCRAYLIARTIA